MRKLLFLIGLSVIFGLGIYIFLLWLGAPTLLIQNRADSSPISSSTSMFSLLTGLPVSGHVTATVPIAVMIDNHPDARPQFGLSNAAIVYEAPVEGDYTRFMAIYESTQTVDKVGPVRSARAYYLDWLAEYGHALYLHCGGSPEALTRIQREEIFAVNEFYWGQYFWRDNHLLAPHNLFISSVNWQKLLWENNLTTVSDWQGWLFSTSLSTTGTDAVSFVIDYGAGYHVEWKFDRALGKYERYVAGVAQRDAAGEQLLFDNVIVQYVNVNIVDEVGRKEIITCGDGSARVFRDGQIISGFWGKNSPNTRTRFRDVEGKEIPLKPGNIWVQIVPATGSVIVTG